MEGKWKGKGHGERLLLTVSRQQLGWLGLLVLVHILLGVQVLTTYNMTVQVYLLSRFCNMCLGLPPSELDHLCELHVQR